MSRLVPKLRFPEFCDALPWVEVPFSDLYRFAPTNTLSRDQLNYVDGKVKNLHYGDIHTRFQALFDVRREQVPFVNPDIMPSEPPPNTLCEVGDMVFADASEDVDDVGKSIEIVELDGQRIVAGTHTILAKRRGSELILGFGGHLFRSDGIRSRIRKESQGAKVLGISPGRLGTIQIHFPPDHNEQQKIADCLTSLDELITAEGRRLESLREHKKGLFQNLFPREGEATPRLRFPEFMEAGEWNEKPLKRICTINPRNGNLPDEFTYIDLESVDSGILVKCNRTLAESAPSRAQRILQNGDTIFQIVRPYQRNNLFVNFADNGDFVASTGYAQLRPLSDPQFLYQVVHHDTFVDRVVAKCTGSNYPAINSSDLAEITVSVPPSEPEQHRIASCLSSIDAIINAQAKKLDILKTHKQGLMQGLFPSMEGR